MMKKESGYGFFDAYPSAYQPPPLREKVHGDRTFSAGRPHLGHGIEPVPMGTSASMVSPQSHLNSYTGMCVTPTDMLRWLGTSKSEGTDCPGLFKPFVDVCQDAADLPRISHILNLE
jgi:hypothetical protein